MKLIVALVKPFKLDDVKEALARLSPGGMTTTEVKGNGRARSRSEVFRGIEYTVDFVPKGKIEIAVPDESVGPVVQEILRAAKTGRPGDGKIFVLPLADVVRIRTDEHGAAAL